MPNTLVHFGLQGVASRRLFAHADVKWIFLGCILPDIPWIFRRAVVALIPSVELYALHVYAIAQASLAVTLLLCAALALLTSRPLLVFGILSVNSFFHLLLDGLQTKWGNGVHLLAPLKWELWNAGWVWPNSPVVWVLTAFGLGYFVWLWRRQPPEAIRPLPMQLRYARYAGRAGLMALYLLLPLAMAGGPSGSDNHFVSTLQAGEDREGRYVEFDRSVYLVTSAGNLLVTYAGDTLRLEGDTPETSGVISARGRFTGPDVVRVYNVHRHAPWLRDGASYLGLLLLGLLWLSALRKPSSPTAGV